MKSFMNQVLLVFLVTLLAKLAHQVLLANLASILQKLELVQEVVACVLQHT